MREISSRATTDTPYTPMVALLEVVAFAPEERALVTVDCAILVGPRDEARETERLAVGVVVVVAVLVWVASVSLPIHARALARHHIALARLLPANSFLPRVLGSSHRVGNASTGTGVACEGDQRPIVQALVIHSIIFPSAVFPIAPAMRMINNVQGQVKYRQMQRQAE